jgi:thioredoxin reductase (NADPH)
MSKVHDLIVIGSGPAGLTAAIYGHRAGLSVLVLGGPAPGGKVARQHRIENYPPFPGGVAGAELMVKWLAQAGQELGAFPQDTRVDRVDFSSRPLKLFAGEESFLARSLILASGSHPRRLGVPGEARLEGKGVFFCATCDAPLLATMERQRALVVGGGDSAAHTALGVLPHAESVTLVARNQFRASPALMKRLRADHKVSFLNGRKVSRVLGEDAVSGLSLGLGQGGGQEEIPGEAVFIGIGNRPATRFLGDALELDEQGFVITNSELAASAPGVFAAGDVRTTPLRQIITAAADGALAAQSAAGLLQMEDS